MKKCFLSLMSAAMLLLASCTQDDLSNLPLGQEMNTKVSMQLPTMQRAGHADPDVNGMRVFLIVSHNGEVVNVETKTATSNTVNFNVRLVTGQSYDLAAWADFGDAYYTVDAAEGVTAPSVSMVMADETITGSDNKRDAYFAISNNVVLDESGVINMTLKRPFGLVKIVTNDFGEDAVKNAGMLPTAYETTIEMPTTLSLVDGAASNDQAVTIAANTVDVAAFGELSYDYIFASTNKELINFTMDYKKGTADLLSYEFKDIPLQRNYKTNISGNILTKQGSVTVTIDQDWEAPDYTVDLMEVAANDLHTALAAISGANKHVTINLTGDLPAGGMYILPAMDEQSTLTINMKGVEESTESPEKSRAVAFTGTDFKGTIKLTNTADASNKVNVTVVVPQGDATIGAGNWGTVTGETRPTTLRIEGGANVETVNVQGGSVNVYEGANAGTINATKETTVYVEEGANVTAGNNVTIVNVKDFSNIMNVTTGKDYATIRAAVMAAHAGDVIELAEGSYDLGTPGQKDATAPFGYYLNIDKAITLRGVGEVTVMTSDEASANEGGIGSLQNLITVSAENVTIENISLQANYNGYYQGPNKIIEVRNAGFTIKNCKFIPNEKAATDCGSAVYFSQAAANGLVEGCTINYATVSFDGLMAGEFTIKNNKFVEGNSNFAFTTPNWTSNDVTTSKLYVNIENNTFEGFEENAEGVNPTVRAYYGILNLKNNTFPTNGIYWKAMQFGSVFVNYNSTLDQYWHKDRTEPKSFAISNNLIEFETQQAPANTWYAWHGRKAAVNMNEKAAWEVSSTLTLTGENRAVNKSIWLNIGCDWPIVLFKQDESGKRFWRYWDSNGSGAWVDVPAETVSTEAGDYTIKFTFNNGVITEYINDIQIASYEVSESATAVKEIIFNSYSIGESYKTTWTYPVVK